MLQSCNIIIKQLYEIYICKFLVPNVSSHFFTIAVNYPSKTVSFKQRSQPICTYGKNKHAFQSLYLHRKMIWIQILMVSQN